MWGLDFFCFLTEGFSSFGGTGRRGRFKIYFCKKYWFKSNKEQKEYIAQLVEQ